VNHRVVGRAILITCRATRTESVLVRIVTNRRAINTAVSTVADLPGCATLKLVVLRIHGAVTIVIDPIADFRSARVNRRVVVSAVGLTRMRVPVVVDVLTRIGVGLDGRSLTLSRHWLTSVLARVPNKFRAVVTVVCLAAPESFVTRTPGRVDTFALCPTTRPSPDLDASPRARDRWGIVDPWQPHDSRKTALRTRLCVCRPSTRDGIDISAATRDEFGADLASK
jgi:hypothetical protein